jgi:hypothetical protein
LENDRAVMTMKKLFALSHVLVGLGAAYAFLASEKKTMDLTWFSMGLMIVFEGLRMFLEDHHAAAAQVFIRIRNACFVLILVEMGWELLH